MDFVASDVFNIASRRSSHSIQIDIMLIKFLQNTDNRAKEIGFRNAHEFATKNPRNDERRLDVLLQTLTKSPALVRRLRDQLFESWEL